MTGEFHEVAAGFPDPFRLLVREAAASTNDELRLLAEGGAPAGLVLLALRQSAGRGRRGATWFSPPAESLAFSILIRPEEPKALWPRLALATGLAVAEAVESFGAAAGIKWPNDVWIRSRKVAGILVEAGRDFVIVGIGINVNPTVFPDEIAEIATSLRIETSLKHPRGAVLAAILRGFALRSREIADDFDDLLASVRQRCVLTGHLISLSSSSGRRQGVCEGIAPGGELLLRSEAGLERLLQADEVRILD
ncbi:MAG: biotin--[acetyl-CoA-carboxylase] ligase [Luteolibacter sp.]|jgi:BirA family biotin operon repressor/biotin-[acetyl-CoA-carboxylase] ligase|nr:biotin--[acetyl-CoA-carboxylase] ligase [Luteolibacter sp.]